MGCTASKNAVAAALDKIDNNKEEGSPTMSTKSNIDEISQSADATKTYPPAEAFVVSLDNNDEQKQVDASILEGDPTTIIKKQPPKRLQKLIDMAQSTETEVAKSAEELEEKLVKADLRRQEYIQKKIDNIQRTTQKLLKDKPEVGEEVVAAACPEKDIKTTSLDDDSKRALLTNAAESST